MMALIPLITLLAFLCTSFDFLLAQQVKGTPLMQISGSYHAITIFKVGGSYYRYRKVSASK